MLVQAHGGAGLVAALAQELELGDHRLLGALHAAQPVVPAHAVEAHVERRVHAELFQLVQEPLVHELAVGVDGVQHEPAPAHLVQDLEEVRVHEGLAAGEGDVVDAVCLELVQDVHALLEREVLAVVVRRGHEAVPALVVAAARDGPLHVVLVDAREALVLLPGIQALRAVGGERDVDVDEVVQQLLLLVGQAALVDVVPAVQRVHHAVVLFVEKVHAAQVGVL